MFVNVIKAPGNTAQHIKAFNLINTPKKMQPKAAQKMLQAYCVRRSAGKQCHAFITD